MARVPECLQRVKEAAVVLTTESVIGAGPLLAISGGTKAVCHLVERVYGNRPDAGIIFCLGEAAVIAGSLLVAREVKERIWIEQNNPLPGGR